MSDERRNHIEYLMWQRRITRAFIKGLMEETRPYYRTIKLENTRRHIVGLREYTRQAVITERKEKP